MAYELLSKINSPDDLKKLSKSELGLLCGEIREKMIAVVSKNGGHLSSNLGVVELTVALHTVFDAPSDSIIFDVGHQCYTHKLLTGRYAAFDFLRQQDGIAGFPRPDESRYDLFVAGHSGQALSAAIGLARAKKLNGDNSKVIVVIGDGSFAGGMVFEAINNIDKSLDNLIVVLNDNEMSISKSIGTISRLLLRLRTDSGYNDTKRRVQSFLERVPVIGKPIERQILRLKSYFRHCFFNGSFFESLGFSYVGAINGHNLDELLSILSNVKTMRTPILVHVLTDKGKGYKPAEENPGEYHGVGSFDADTGLAVAYSEENYSTVFGKLLKQKGESDNRICAITAAMKYATGLNFFSKAFPERFFDVGISEEHAVTFCAGLAKGGKKPVFAVYSTFLQRGYDQLLHDIILGNMDVMLAVDRAGIVGDDGETHQGIFDASFLSSIGFEVVSPCNYSELEYWTSRLLSESGPRAIRYPRGAQFEPLAEYSCSGNEFDFIDGGNDILFVTYGRIVANVLEAQRLLSKADIHSSVLKLNIINPIPPQSIETAAMFRKIIFVEEGIADGGINEHFLRLLSEKAVNFAYKTRAIESRIVKHGSVNQTLERLGLDGASISALAKELLSEDEN